MNIKLAYKKGIAISLLVASLGSTEASALASAAKTSLVEKEDITTGIHLLRGGDRVSMHTMFANSCAIQN